ncbi:hypothetical protein [Parasitella parasitica]|uniref:[histone H3]-trimethyl-L-lysine(4) demethylase n=1 Tax=Parasitella parasitica TaxID=35722 RepID=A0A0B7NF52_9FUNG|nr:hypothetical protein [Parasitella parasitica]
MRRAAKNTIKNSETSSTLPFDLSSVKTKSEEPVGGKSKRLFGIEEAPTFYPTKDEFKDPLSYIEKISPEGEKYGIIKIIPPKDYNPDFSLKTETFRFRTRIQKLNSMEGETRTNVNYLEQLNKYHILTGKPVGKIPQLDKRPIDLYKLKNEVAIRGGVQEVTRLKKWAEIGRVLGYARKQCTSMSNALKTAYQKVILPYEIWYAKHKDNFDQFTVKEEHGSSSSTDSNENDTCEICHKSENEEKLLLCDGCNRGFHMYCLNPPLAVIPKTDWFCFQCLTAVGKDYGFEDGNEYSLSDFHTVCQSFKKNWFEKTHSVNVDTVTEEECESEFWRLVENPHETCQVEYGADLHSTQHGSGFSTADHIPKGAFDPWNLNVIPVVPQSLFTYIKSDISGMMVPWLYVGMCFSAFCWHNEDHYTYSINYMHWGETKTWYGVPGSDTAKFEAAMKKAVPELFDQQPDLLFQLITMLSPERLVKEDVNVYAVDQRPGQFVITYPKAYHSGFNHGFNFCEAVNFAPGEWIDFGLECVKRYKAFRRQPCFSHDNLLVTAARNLKSVDKIDWLKRGLTEMQSREIKERQNIRAKKLAEKVVPEDQLREELQCVFCNCYTYLSYISCECTSKVGCLDHATELCTCEMSSKVMKLQFTDIQLDELVQSVVHTGPTPTDWVDKLENAMNVKSGPTIKKLRDLLKEAHNNDIPQEPIDNLKNFIEILDQWNTDADRLLGVKHDTLKHNETRYERCQNLIRRASEIGFDLVQLPDVEAYATKLEDLDNEITPQLLSSGNFERQKNTFDRGLQLRADSINFKKLRKAISYSSWEESVQQAFSNHFVAKTYKKLIKEGEDMAMNAEDDPLFKRLADTENFGKRIVHYVENVIKGREKIDMNDQESIFNIGHNTANPELSIELDPQLISRLRHSISRSISTLVELDVMLNSRCTKTSIAERPTIFEAQKLTTLSRELCFNSELATRLAFEMSRNSSWNEHLRSTLMNGRQKALDVILKEIITNVQRITQSEGKPNLYCICRKPESGLMIECDVCHEWYHGSCLKVARNAARSTSSYVCLICHPSEASKKIPHQSRQPTLKELTDLVNFGEALSFRPKDYEAVSSIHKIMQDYKSHVQTFCRSKKQLELEDVNRIKYYLRTLMGLEVLLLDEAEFLRSKVETLAPVIEPVVKSTTTSPTYGPSSILSTGHLRPHHEKSLSRVKQIVDHGKPNDAERHTLEAISIDKLANPLTPVNIVVPVDSPQPLEAAKSGSLLTKRKLVTTVGPSPPSRPHKIIKLTVKPPKPTSISTTSPSPSSSTSSSSSSSSSKSLVNPSKKRKHKHDDNSSNKKLREH